MRILLHYVRKNDMKHKSKVVRSSAYSQGYQAYRSGQPNTSNPYRSLTMENQSRTTDDLDDLQAESRNRTHWFNGWYDAKFVAIWPDYLYL